MPVIYKAVGSDFSTEKEKHRREKKVGKGKGRRKKERKKIGLFSRNNFPFGRK